MYSLYRLLTLFIVSIQLYILLSWLNHSVANFHSCLHSGHAGFCCPLWAFVHFTILQKNFVSMWEHKFATSGNGMDACTDQVPWTQSYPNK